VHLHDYRLTLGSGICGYKTGTSETHGIIRAMILKIPDHQFPSGGLSVTKRDFHE
jgi:hypothetical protein